MPRRSAAASSSAQPAEPIVVDLLDSDDDEPVVDESKQPQRRSTRTVRIPDTQQLLCFPSAEVKESISITYGDLRRLRRPERDKVCSAEQLLLNDSLVDFYVKYLQAEAPAATAELLPGLLDLGRWAPKRAPED